MNYLKKVNFFYQRQKVEKFIRIAKKDYYYQKFNKCIGDSRQVFKVLNEINGKTAKSSKISALLINNNELSDPVLISNVLNDYFASVGTKLASKIDLVEPVIKIEDVSQSMYLFNSTICEIIDVTERLKPKHTCGIDEISNLF